MVKAKLDSTKRLGELSFGYFIFYVITGLSVKFFLSQGAGRPGLNGMEYLFYSTFSSTLIVTTFVLIRRWYKINSVRRVQFGKYLVPSELKYILPSGVLTAVVIPTTTLMYSFRGISVMVAMVLMRGSVIIISRVVDEIQIRKGLLKKKVYIEENIGVIFALLAIGTKIFSGGADGKVSPFASLPVMVVFSAYIVAYAFRIYIMNYYKNTRPKESKGDNNKSFFAIEQIASTLTLFLVVVVIILFAKVGGVTGDRVTPFVNAIFSPVKDWWYWAMIVGSAFGMVAFFSVFLFMFKGRTATFAGLVNRLTSLIAGTTSTVIFAFAFGGKFPIIVDWISLFFILVAVYFIAKAEKKRTIELAMEKNN
ncbi:MAG: hypothetical protein PF551_02560 [Candidatus Marinimicrobia bacterium]|jgi:hypothetical protein|nr:hypothetical protein [Candidatus Neomarinimicrobiota bacterium]